MSSSLDCAPHQEHIITEKQILAEIDHPFCVKLHTSFKDTQSLFMVLDYCPGGELFNRLKKERMLPEEQVRAQAHAPAQTLASARARRSVCRRMKKARGDGVASCPSPSLAATQAVFYSASVMLAFEYLHDLNIIYRDLKVACSPRPPTQQDHSSTVSPSLDVLHLTPHPA
eukprot:7061516-Prymnesium_polylepis.1